MQSHQQIIDREKRKLNERGVLVLTEVYIDRYVFDVVGIRLPSKEVEIIEVDYTHTTSEEEQTPSRLGNELPKNEPLQERMGEKTPLSF